MSEQTSFTRRPWASFSSLFNYYLIATKGTLPRLGTGQCGTWVGSIIKVQ